MLRAVCWTHTCRYRPRGLDLSSVRAAGARGPGRAAAAPPPPAARHVLFKEEWREPPYQASATMFNQRSRRQSSPRSYRAKTVRTGLTCDPRAQHEGESIWDRLATHPSP